MRFKEVSFLPILDELDKLINFGQKDKCGDCGSGCGGGGTCGECNKDGCGGGD